MITETGRDLDERIAKEVMNKSKGEAVPAYSSAIEHAWSVVETMFNRGYTCHVSRTRDGKAQVIFEEIRGETVINRGSAKNAVIPEAICIAALDAIEKIAGDN